MLADYRADSTVVLPGGLVLDDSRRIEEAELQPLTGREEDWLASHPSVPNAVAVSHLLTGCLVQLGGRKPTSDLIGRLLVADRQFLVLHLRRLTLGNRFNAVIECPACSEKMDVSFDAGSIPVEARPQTSPSYSLTLPENAETPVRTVRFRLPNGADQEAILGVPAEQAVQNLLARCLLDDGGQPLTAPEQTALSAAMEAVAPQIEPELDLTCPECGTGFTAPFDTNGFFFNEMRSNARQMLREIHMLAFYYHWSESEILALPRERRRAYLGLLSDELKRD